MTWNSSVLVYLHISASFLLVEILTCMLSASQSIWAGLKSVIYWQIAHLFAFPIFIVGDTNTYEVHTARVSSGWRVQRSTWGQNQPFVTVLHLSVWNIMPTLKSSCGRPREGLTIRVSIWCEVEIVKVGRCGIQMSCFYVFSCRGEEVSKANFPANTRGGRWWLPWELLTPRPQCWATAGMWDELSMGGALEATRPPPLCHSHKVELTTSEMGLVARCSLGLRSPCEMQQIPFSCCNSVSLLSNSRGIPR